MITKDLNGIATALAAGLRETLCSFDPRFLPQLWGLLAKGRPVSATPLASTLRISLEEATAALRRLPNVEFDENGDVVGSGLTLNPTPHHFQVDGPPLFTWCALDALFFPVILQRPARVESSCPITGVKVRLRVTPEGVEDLEPAGAVVSIVIPEASDACCDIRGAFCHQVHFFSSPDAASSWLTEQPEARILPVEDAFKLGHILTEQLFAPCSVEGRVAARKPGKEAAP
jgi:alkylmercury lyase